MGDLISREVLTKALETAKATCKRLHEYVFFDAVLAIIDNQPTAYDVDEVVEQLKKVSYETHEWSDGTSSFNLRMIEEANAIEIVKGAVKDE